jgi:CheY-like chemotaxis protein
MATGSLKQPAILYVESNSDDVLEMTRRLVQAAPAARLTLASPDNAKDILFASADAGELPGLIFIGVPHAGTQAFHFVAWLRREPLFSQVPRCVLGLSAREHDIEQAIELGAFAYLLKFPTVRQVMHVLTCAKALSSS